MRRLFILFFALLCAPVSVLAEDFRPVLIYVTGETDSDRAFIDMARTGAERAKEELGIEFEEFRLPENEDPTSFMRGIAEKGYSPIIGVGYQNVVAVLTLAEKFPKTRFTVIDGLVPPIYQNVQSIAFKDHEGAFLIGMLAAYSSENDKIGFIGGMDVPLIRNFAYGYAQGARFASPKIDIISEMIGDTPAAWSSPDAAYNMAVKQYQQGADVVFSAAGGSSIGALRAAKDEDQLAIGVDTNQNGTYPGHVLTSLVKRVDQAVFTTLRNAYHGSWQAGIKMQGVKEAALDFSVDQHNRTLLSQKIIDQVLITRERIINGLVEVKMYTPE